MECHAIAEDLQQNISRITGDSDGKGKLNTTSFIAGNTQLRQNLEEPHMTPSMWQPTLKARPPFSHKPHKELKGRTEKPREKGITCGDLAAEKKTTHGDLTTPINKLKSHPKTSQREKRVDQRRKKK